MIDYVKDWLVNMFSGNVIQQMLKSFINRLTGYLGTVLAGQQVAPELIAQFMESTTAILISLAGVATSLLVSWMQKAKAEKDA